MLFKLVTLKIESLVKPDTKSKTTAKYEFQMQEVIDMDSDSSWEDVVEDDATGEPFCDSLLLNSLILEKIFEHLPTTDLLTCRLVCREWNRTSLLRKVLGSKFEILVTKANFDRLLKTAQTSPFPFCRKFDFRLVELEYDKVSKFIRLVGDRLNNLSLKFCTASTAESVIKILNCPRLEELKIYGALPEIRRETFHSFFFTRLKKLEFHSSLDYGQVDQKFINIILEHAPNIQVVNIGQSLSLWLDFCAAISLMTVPKLRQVELLGIEAAIEIDHFRKMFEKHLPLYKISFQNCLVGQEFLHQFLQQFYRCLTVIHVEGTQQEILSKAFRELRLPHVKQLTLPIDGVSNSDGNCILESLPKLTVFKVSGLFETVFSFHQGQLVSVSMHEKYFTTLFARENLQQTLILEKRREFLKVLSLIPLQPQILEINLVAHINSKCLRAVYRQYPDLEQLQFVSPSAKQCMVGLTGIPYRACKRMTICKTFSVLNVNNVQLFTSLSSLKKLKNLKLTVLEESTSTELTLLLILYGICEVECLTTLSLNGFTMSDVALMVLSQKVNLSSCHLNGSEEQWLQFLSVYRKHTIKSFLLPPPVECMSLRSSAEYIAHDTKLLQRVFSYMELSEIFEARKVCRHWHSVASEHVHQLCRANASQCLTTDIQRRLIQYQKNNPCPCSPKSRNLYYLGEKWIPAFSNVMQLLSTVQAEISLVILSLDRSVLEFFQLDNCKKTGRQDVTCRQQCQLEYWYYPDGSDELIYPPIGNLKSEQSFNSILPEIKTLFVIGSWGRKDNALMEFFNPSWPVGEVNLIGLVKEALDLVMPKLTSMMNLESLLIKPWVTSSSYLELTRTHLQILCNASFKLKKLKLQLNAPSEAVVDFVRSQRFTLETLQLHSNINISDRLTFGIPQLKVLHLDEPPGCLLWTTLNVHSSLESINFGRSGCAYNQVKNKTSVKLDPVDTDFEHSATEILCDLNWFLETTAYSRRTGLQKSILQQGSDSALKFFTHFPYLSSLCLRSVHAHYGILQGIFKKFTQLKKLELINATGITDEILTGFSRDVLNEMDIMNPFRVTRDRYKTESQRKGRSSIRNLKCLTHLSLDDQPLCTDFSIIFGILRLHQLEYFSCKKWKITDIAVRALSDVLPQLKEIKVDGCVTVSKHAIEYFKESRTRQPFVNSIYNLTEA